MNIVTRIASLFTFAFICVATLSSHPAFAGKIEVRGNQLYIDNQAQPQLFGAEVQYFRMRGGFGRNVPRAKVIALWEKALDRFVEAKMNSISFYIPWDFHEYAPGKFDFDGTVDEDGDGNPDYPSRDVKTFFKMIEARGIKNIFVRPGPYINAEWGFLGFGAIPLWFHEKYPNSHMHNAQGLRTKLYDYHDPDLLRHTQLWFAELYRQVLQSKIGPGKPVSFLQLDNETNFMWQSLYNHDYGPAAIQRYQDFLKNKYVSLDALNTAHGRTWSQWSEVKAPVQPGARVAEDQDWYRFADESIFSYLQKVRRMWENLGVHEPDVMFVLADSYNATQHGLLPNYELHNAPGRTGLLTVNLYPKTYETSDKALLNLPFKSDHDVKAAESASELYLGKGQKWAMGPEIQGGWWRGIDVSPEARRQTYLSVLGHGLKAIFVYYFNEGDNWQSDWAEHQIRPMFTALRHEKPYAGFGDNELPNEFWNTLQSQVDHQLVAGLDARYAILYEDQKISAKLYFDSPLDGEAQPRNHFYDLKFLGEKIMSPYGAWLGKADEVMDPVCLIKDVRDHVPTALSTIDNVQMNSDWAAGLMAYALRAGANVRMFHWGLNDEAELANCKVILRQDPGYSDPHFAQVMKQLANDGHTIVNFLEDSLARQIGTNVTAAHDPVVGDVRMTTNDGQVFGAQYSPLANYYLPANSACSSLLKRESFVSAYSCPVGKGQFVQVGALFHDLYNSNMYTWLGDLPARESFLKSILASAGVTSAVKVETDKVVAFARQVSGEKPLWITVKSSNQQSVAANIRVRDVDANQTYVVRNLLNDTQQTLKGDVLQRTGFTASIDRFGSTAFWVEPSASALRKAAR